MGEASGLEMASDGEVRAAMRLFEQFDSDGDGALQPQEFVDMILAIVKLNGRSLTRWEARSLFDEADVDLNGYVDVNEMLHILQKLALKPLDPSTETEYRERCTNRSSSVALGKDYDASSIYAGTEGGQERYASELDRAVAMFRRIDKARSGLISRAQLEALMSDLAAEAGRPPYSKIEKEALWRRADLDGSGMVDLNELLLLLRRHSPAPHRRRRSPGGFWDDAEDDGGAASPGGTSSPGAPRRRRRRGR